MKPIVPYLFFNGNCREAMNFYQGCFGGKLEISTYGDAPAGKTGTPDGRQPDKNQIMHAALSDGEFMLMASDNPMGAPVVGNNISVSIPCDSIPQTQRLFQALSVGGKVTMPLADTFWGAHFGMLTDKYGIHWMLNCDQGRSS